MNKTMNTFSNRRTMKLVNTSKWFLVFIVALFGAQACSDNEAISLWDPSVEQPISVNPEIISISPEGGYLAGVDAITVTGTGFSTNVEDNNIYFSGVEDRGVKGLIQSATSTQLVVRPPQLVGNDLEVVISTAGTERLSNIINYSLAAPQLPGYGTFNANADEPLNIAIGPNNTLFVALTTGGNPQGIIRVDLNSDDVDPTTYITPNNRFRWDDIGFAGGELYMALGLRAVFRGIEGGREGAHFIMPNPFNFVAFDVDNEGNMWLVGDNSHIVRHEPQTARTSISNINALPDNTKIYEFAADASAVFYFENKIYVAGNDGEAAKVWTLDLDANRDVTAINEFANLSVLLGDVNLATLQLNDMSMAADGTVYIATNRAEGIIEVSPDGSAAAGLYPGVIQPLINGIYWQDNSEYLFISRVAPDGVEYTNNVLRVNMQKAGAPDFK